MGTAAKYYVIKASRHVVQDSNHTLTLFDEAGEAEGGPSEEPDLSEETLRERLEVSLFRLFPLSISFFCLHVSFCCLYVSFLCQYHHFPVSVPFPVSN